MVGLTNNRSVQDEKLIEAIFQSHHNPESRVSSGTVYGATATNLIIDARPTTNAVANVAKGAGTENMDYYKEGKKAYLGIDNIHVMRDSLNKVVEALREADAMASAVSNDELARLASAGSSFLDRHALRRSGWLRHISAILDGTALIIKNVHINSSHVLVHCSDGWDRTAQLSSLSQLCLDPFYRTIRGFQILVEKDWVSFGHKFLDRCGHLSSEKFFMASSDTSGGSAEVAQAFLASVQNRIAGQGHLKEISPVFHQFLECVRQIQRQYPSRFEFNSYFLEQIHYHLYSCQFGTFLFNTERERRTPEGGLPAPCERTASVWDFLNSSSEKQKMVNEDYDPSLDNPTRRDGPADMGVLIPNPKDVRFWNELYGRTDEEMNGKIVIAEAVGAEIIGPVESGQDDPVSVVATSDPALSASMPLPGPSSRSTSPMPPPSVTAPTPPGLSSSMPELSKQTHTHDRSDSFRPFDSTASAFTMRTNPQSHPSTAGSSTSDILSNWASQARPRGKQVEILSSGVKSMWGRFSNNATAAISAVQSAYDGVAKELKTSQNAEDYDQRSPGELQNQFSRRSAITDDRDWTSTSSNTSTIAAYATPSGDKWRTAGVASGLGSLTLENPWGTTSSTRAGRTTPKRVEELFTTQSVWNDEPSRLETQMPSAASSNTHTSRIAAKEGGTLSSIAPSIRPAATTLHNQDAVRLSGVSRSQSDNGSGPLDAVVAANIPLPISPPPVSRERQQQQQQQSDPLGVSIL
jgi:hypothetical protein